MMGQYDLVLFLATFAAFATTTTFWWFAGLFAESFVVLDHPATLGHGFAFFARSRISLTYGWYKAESFACFDMWSFALKSHSSS